MDQSQSDLINVARAVCDEFTLGHGHGERFSAASVGAALRTAGGRIYTGICIDLASGLGFCAEVAAIAEMLKTRETQIEMIVAVAGERILSPCGRCRETMAQIDARNLDCKVLLPGNRVVALRELLPDHWLAKP